MRPHHIDGFVLRNPTEEAADGLPPGEDALLPCRSGSSTPSPASGRDEVVALFARLLGLCNDVGLLSEEDDPQVGAPRRQLPAGLQPHRARQQRDGPVHSR